MFACPGAAVAELRSISAAEVPQLIEEGYKVIDVRDERQYQKSHIKNSEHVPLFIENTAMDPSECEAAAGVDSKIEALLESVCKDKLGC